MSDLVPVLSGTVVPAARASIRDVAPERWDGTAAWNLAVDIWLDSKKSAHSRSAYRRDISLWFRWCKQNGVPLDAARRGDVDAWRGQLPGAPATIARRLAAVSSFYTYYLTEDLVARNPAANAERPAVSADPGSIGLTLEQARTLLAYADGLSDPRPAVIVRLLAQTGMRISELTGAHIGDLAMTEGHHVLWVIRKGGKPKALPVAGSTYERVIAYIGRRALGYLIHVDPTSRREGDGRMDRSYVRRLLRRLAREAGLPPQVWQHMSPHVLRHSAATLLHADGVPARDIQELLGHANLATTQRYIHASEALDDSPVYKLAGLLAR